MKLPASIRAVAVSLALALDAVPNCPGGDESCGTIEMGEWCEGSCCYLSQLLVCSCGTCDTTFRVCDGGSSGSVHWTCS